MNFMPLKKCNESDALIWIDGIAYKKCSIEYADIIIKL